MSGWAKSSHGTGASNWNPSCRSDGATFACWTRCGGKATTRWPWVGQGQGALAGAGFLSPPGESAVVAGDLGQQEQGEAISGAASESVGLDDAKNRGAAHGQTSGPASVANIR